LSQRAGEGNLCLRQKNIRRRKMQFKQKLIYFALGCAFVVIGQVLLSVVVPKVTAQGKKESVEFDTVKARSLQVVDDSGKVRAQLEFKEHKGTTSTSDVIMDDVIQVFNDDGNPIFRVGENSMWGSSGGIVILYQNTPHRPVALMRSAQFFGGGFIGVASEDEKSIAKMEASKAGSSVEVRIKNPISGNYFDGKYASMRVGTLGEPYGGVVEVSDKDSNPARALWGQ
jgi:hypothetical protein